MAGTSRCAITACEPSGDSLAAGLMQSLQELRPELTFSGLAGPRMRRAGCEPLAPMEEFAVMGLVEVAMHLPRLWRRRRQLAGHWLRDQPRGFVGVDAPDFNLGLAARLKQAGIPTAQYVSPSVWAWRPGRVKQVAKAVDLLMALLPFEPDSYRDSGVAVEFVGHPLVDAIPEPLDRQEARTYLGLNSGRPTVALLPGSRRAEVERLFPLFLDVAQACNRADAALQFAVPAATPELYDLMQKLLAGHAESRSVSLFQGDTRQVIAASDVALAASGTVTLECLLLERPMLVAYRLNPVSYRVMRRLLRIPRVSLPNLLAGRDVVPEFLQDRACVEELVPSLLQLLESEKLRNTQRAIFREVRARFPAGASQRAAHCLLRHWGEA